MRIHRHLYIIFIKHMKIKTRANVIKSSISFPTLFFFFCYRKDRPEESDSDGYFDEAMEARKKNKAVLEGLSIGTMSLETILSSVIYTNNILFQ